MDRFAAPSNKCSPACALSRATSKKTTDSLEDKAGSSNKSKINEDAYYCERIQQ